MVKIRDKVHKTGTLGSAYIEILDINDCSMYDNITIILTASNDFDYKITESVYSGGTEHIGKEETIIKEIGSETANKKIMINSIFDNIKVYMKYTTLIGIYNADYIGQYKSQLPN